MSSNKKVNNWSHIIFLVLCILILVLGYMILVLPESCCNPNDLQVLNRISNQINYPGPNVGLNPPVSPVPPEEDVVELGEDITCGSNGGSYTGEEMYPGHQNFILGTEIGNTEIHFMPHTYPDRFIVFYNNKPVIDTGYRGYNEMDGIEFKYNTIGDEARQHLIVNPLQGKIDPISNLRYPNTSIPNTLSDGYPKVITTPLEGYTASFNKYSASITDVDVYIYAPYENTSWDLYVNCPG